MIQSLNCGLSPGAQPAAADGIEWVAFDFLDCGDALANLLALVGGDALAFHDAREGAASRAASGANGGVPLFFTRDEFMLRHEQRHQLADAGSAAGGEGSGGSCGQNSEEDP